MNNDLSDEHRQIRDWARREDEAYQQAQDVYEWQLAQIPLRVDFGSDEDYDAAVTAWDEICEALKLRAHDLQRTS